MAKTVKEPPPLRRFVVVLSVPKRDYGMPSQRIAIHARYVGIGRSLELYFADSPIGRQDGYGGVQFDDCKAAFRPGQWLEFYELASGFEPPESNFAVTPKPAN
jgi:hypothetical protein